MWRFRLSELSRWLESEAVKIGRAIGVGMRGMTLESTTVSTWLFQPSSAQEGAGSLGLSGRLPYFRHTYSTLLKANREDVKVVQELMRHAVSTTMNIYTKALTSAKREAQSRVVDILLDRSRNVSESVAEDAA
jgi:integrase